MPDVRDMNRGWAYRAETGRESPPRHEIGQWVYLPKTFELAWTPINGSGYNIDLDDCTDAAQVLDWILQLSHKGWLSDQSLGQLIRAMDKVFKYGLQGAVCPWGENTEIDPRVEAGLPSIKAPVGG